MKVAKIPTSEGTERPYIFLKADRKMVKIYLDEIMYIESLKDYVRIKTENRENYISSKDKLPGAKKLPEDCFYENSQVFLLYPRKKNPSIFYTQH